MGFKHSRTILPQHLEILEGSTDKWFSIAAAADKIWEGGKGMWCEQGGVEFQLLIS